jgi:arsenite-transporting ATPase
MALWQQALPLAERQVDAQAQRSGSALRACGQGQKLVIDPAPLPESSIKLLLFAGKGGVGKTTLACASALRLAQERPGHETLLFSIDPAHSLGACLERDVGPQETRVAPGLTVIELDAPAEYAVLKKNYAEELTGVFGRTGKQGGVELAFDRDLMERILDVAPPGLDEMLALTRVVDLMDRKRYDLFVLDTAPTGHLLRFLEMPALIENWLKTFFGLFLKYRDVFWLPKITKMMVELSRKMKTFRQLLTDASRSAVVAVAIPTELAFAETQNLIAACERLGTAVPILFLNLLTPTSLCPICSVRSGAEQPLIERYRLTHARCHVGSVFQQEEPRGMGRLGALGRALYRDGQLS